MERIYLDHAATTPLDARVLEKMQPYFCEVFGNPDSPHAFGRRAVAAVDAARDEVASLLGAKPNEIFFTSGGTESDNWALRGAAHALADRGRHVVVSAVEHAAVLEAAALLEGEGFSVSRAPVDAEGAVDVEQFSRLLRPDTVLAAVMAANNEVGTVQPLGEISALCRERGIVLFCDAVQAAGALPLGVNAPHVDLLSISAHKFYGPKGAGALYVRAGIRLGKLIAGGHQERGLRGGTTNVAGAVGLAEALRIACAEREQNAARLRALRDGFCAEIARNLGGVHRNGAQNGLPGLANLRFDGVDGEALLYSLDLAGVAASAGAACSSGSPEPSHVLLAMGLAASEARSCVRFSFGRGNTAQDAARAAAAVCACVERLRGRAPRPYAG